MNIASYSPSMVTAVAAIGTFWGFLHNNKKANKDREEQTKVHQEEELRLAAQVAAERAKQDQEIKDTLQDILHHLGNGSPGLIHDVAILKTQFGGLYCIQHPDYDGGRLRQQVETNKEDIEDLRGQKP